MPKLNTEVVNIVIIKEGDKILLQENDRYGDVFFVGGKIEEENANPYYYAHKKIEKRLQLQPGADFFLEPLKPSVIELNNRYSESEHTYKNYQFHLFFMKINSPNAKSKINSNPKNHWIPYLNVPETLSNGRKISQRARDILINLDLEYLDSFQPIRNQISTEYENLSYEERKSIYEKEVEKWMLDEDTYGWIDEKEQIILNEKARRLGILENDAVSIENKIKNRDVKKLTINNLELLSEIAKNFRFLFDDLEKYARDKQYYQIEIIKVYNEGLTGAAVFQVKGEGDYARGEYILKYDYHPRIKKEYELFNNNNVCNSAYTVSSNRVYKGINISNHSFLELQPADQYINARKLISLRKLIEEELSEHANRVNLQNNLISSLKEIYEYFFDRLYCNLTQKHSYRIEEDSLQNTVDQFLPARRVYKGIIGQKDKDYTDLNYKKLPKHTRKIISYDFKGPSEDNKKIQCEIKMMIKQKNSHWYRMDLICEITRQQKELLKKPEELSFWTTHFVENKRKKLLKQIEGKTQWLWEQCDDYKIEPILKPLPTPLENSSVLDLNYHLELLLKKQCPVYYSNFLHGDFNPSNILLCRKKEDQYHPIIIDFYETGIEGNIFYDLARMEIEILVMLLTQYLNKDRGISLDTEKLPQEIIEAILDWEENLFFLRSSSLSFSGDFIAFGMRRNLFNIAIELFKEDYHQFDWLKNYLIVSGVFALGFNKFQKESPLSKTIATLWAARQFYRFSHFDQSLDGIIEEFLPEKFLKQQISEYDSLITLCNNNNKLTRLSYNLPRRDKKLFIQYNEKNEHYLSSFLNQNDKNCFFIVDEDGTGKSWFVDNCFDTEPSLYPVLFLSGTEPLSENEGFDGIIKEKLHIPVVDWGSHIEYILRDKNYSLIIVLENLSECPYPNLTNKALLNLVKYIRGKKIKLILVSRPWFWFQYLEDNEFIKESCYQIPDKKDPSQPAFYIQMERPEGKHQKELVDAFFWKYKIEGNLFGNALEKLRNPGLLKLFCEVKEKTQIGSIDNIFLYDIMKNYVERKTEAIAKSAQMDSYFVQKMASLTTELMFISQLPYIKIKKLNKDNPSVIEEVGEGRLQELLEHCRNYSFIITDRKHIFFTFEEVSSFIRANELIEQWNTNNQLTEKHIEDWLLKNLLTQHNSTMMENLFRYIIFKLYNDQEDKSLFYAAVQSIISYYDKSPALVLRIISRTLSELPKLPPKIMKIINNFKKKIENDPKSRGLFIEREINIFFYRLDYHIDDDACNWTTLFNVTNTEVIAKRMKEMDRDKQRLQKFFSFLQMDYKYNKHFMENYLKPHMSYFIKNNQGLESYLIRLCEYILKLHPDNQPIWPEIYHILFSIGEKFINSKILTQTAISNQALGIISSKKTYHSSTFQMINNLYIQWSRKYKDQQPILDKIHNSWICFLIQYLPISKDKKVSVYSYEQIKETLPNIEFGALGKNTQGKVIAYLEKGLPRTKQIIDSTKNKIPEGYLKQLAPKIKMAMENTPLEKQKVVYVIFKRGNEILLQYKEKWMDFSWIGSQMEEGDDPRELAIQAISDKLHLQYKEHFEVENQVVPLPDFENFSHTREHYVIYTPYLVFARFKHKHVSDIVENQKINQFFSVEELLHSGNFYISWPVKEIIRLINQANIWNKIPTSS